MPLITQAIISNRELKYYCYSMQSTITVCPRSLRSTQTTRCRAQKTSSSLGRRHLNTASSRTLSTRTRPPHRHHKNIRCRYRPGDRGTLFHDGVDQRPISRRPSPMSIPAQSTPSSGYGKTAKVDDILARHLQSHPLTRNYPRGHQAFTHSFCPKGTKEPSPLTNADNHNTMSSLDG